MDLLFVGPLHAAHRFDHLPIVGQASRRTTELGLSREHTGHHHHCPVGVLVADGDWCGGDWSVKQQFQTRDDKKLSESFTKE